MDTRVREYDGAVWLDRLFLHLTLRRHTRSEERTIWYPFLQLDDSTHYTMDTRFGNMLLHCSTTYIHVSMREYVGVVLIDRLFLHFALRRHTRSEERAILYPVVQLNDSTHCTMDTRIREYDDAVWFYFTFFETKKIPTELTIGILRN